MLHVNSCKFFSYKIDFEVNLKKLVGILTFFCTNSLNELQKFILKNVLIFVLICWWYNCKSNMQIILFPYQKFFSELNLTKTHILMSKSQLKYKLFRNAMYLKTKFEWFLKSHFRPEKKYFVRQPLKTSSMIKSSVYLLSL